jgi:hypothetical protein
MGLVAVETFRINMLLSSLEIAIVSSNLYILLILYHHLSCMSQALIPCSSSTPRLYYSPFN